MYDTQQNEREGIPCSCGTSAMISKSIDTISKADIESLIENKVRECRTIDYKQTLPGNSDSDKKEFLADISSFANAGGGDLLYGVSETDGLPQEMLGLEGNLDAEQSRLENIVRTCLKPRVQGLRMRLIEGGSKGPILLIRVPNSWNAPHMVDFGGSTRFFVRNSAGKHQMDVSEIRASFLLSEAVPEKIRRFKDGRLGKIIANKSAVRLIEGAKLVLHILPVDSFTTGRCFEVSVLKEKAISVMAPIGSSGYSNMYNLDGFITYNSAGSNLEYRQGRSAAESYALLFRNGLVESVCADLTREKDGKWFIPGTAYEEYIIKGVIRYITVLKALGIAGPLVMFVTIIGVHGVCLSVDYRLSGGNPIDRDLLVLPEIFVEDYEALLDKNITAKALRPIFDSVWNACGFDRSYNYDENGNWVGMR